MEKSIKKLHDYMQNENIQIEYCKELDHYKKLALYCSINNNKIILLNPKFDKLNKYKKIDIIAEECGHHATSIGDNTREINTTIDKIMHDKVEKKAIIWGANYLIDEDDFKKYINISTCVEEFAELLGVSEVMLYEYLYDKRKKMQYIELDCGKLNLYKLPNIVIERSDEDDY